MSEIEQLRNVIDNLSKLYTKCFNTYVAMLLIGVSIMGILGIWVLWQNAKNKYIKG